LLSSAYCFAVDNKTLSLRVVTEDMPPYNYINQQGTLDGISSLIVNELLKKLGTKQKIEVLPWARAFRVAMSEPNVLIFSILRNQKREDKFHWLSPIFPVKMSLFSLSHNRNISIENLEDINRQTIGVLRNSSYVNFLLSHENIDDSIIVKGVVYEQLYKMLQHGRIELLLAPAQVVHFLDNKFSTQRKLKPVVSYKLPLLQGNQIYLALSKQTSLTTVKLIERELVTVLQSDKIKQAIKTFNRSN